MVNTTTEILTINGVSLNTLAKNIESIAGRLRAPSKRTSNITVPGRTGDLWVANKRFASNTITLPMWIQGCNDDGAIPSGSTKRREFFKRVDELVALFHAPGLLDIRWTKADGSVRQCFAEVLDVLNFTTDAAPTGMVGVVLTIPGAFWQDVNTSSQTLTGTGTTMTPSNFSGGTAPIEDMIYDITGPWTNPRVTFSDGSWFEYSAALAAGHVLTVDSGTWTLTGAGGLTVNYSNLTHDGEDAYWGALPASAAAITLAGSARDATSSIKLTGRRKYLVG